MKQFVFSLQSLYDIQGSNEKKYKIQMGDIEEELRKKIKDLEVLNANYEKLTKEYCKVVSRGVPASKIKEYGDFFERLKTVIGMVQDKIKSLENEKEKCLQKLIQVHKEIKLLDKLRETKYEEYMDELKKTQDKRIDDLISYRVSNA